MDEGATIDAALKAAADALTLDPREAERRARAILARRPGLPGAVIISARARSLRGDLAGARALLAPLAEAYPGDAVVQLELAEVLAAAGDRSGALGALRAAVAARSDFGPAWRGLGEQLFLSGDHAGADAAFARYVAAPIAEPVIGEAGRSMAAAEWARAEGLLRGRLKFRPHDVQVLAMLGETLRRRSRFAEAETFLRRCLERHPSYDSVAHGLALCLRALGREAEALVLIGPLAARDPGNIGLQDLRASCLAAVGDPAAALAIFEAMPREAEGNTGLWVSRGLALKSVGRSVEATGAFRRAIALAPAHGEAWWRLAELRAGTFTAADEAALRKALATAGLDILSRVHLHYALARAREDQGDAAEAFALYEAGARLNRSRLPYDAAETTARRRGQEALFTTAFFQARVGGGAPDPAPIFLVGLPRCGSTLVEQILASHSAVEGTSELPYLPMIERAIAGGAAGTDPALPVAALSTADRGAFGEAYLARAAAHRRIGRPRFIDKNLGNFQNIGLIELILPRATIIDVRRHPLASGVALFRHLLGPGWTFACGLEDIGGFYRDYVALMAHFDAVLPGRVHRVIYEDLVEDTEATVRRLLDHCGLPFEDACLRFHDTERAVLTPSAAQVRRPMFREGLDGWRRFEPWLAPLKAALGPALTQWR